MKGSPVPPTLAAAYTDGACVGNPGPGGWGVVLLFPDGTVRELGGSPKSPEKRPLPTTNNRMELQAGIEAIKAWRGSGQADGSASGAEPVLEVRADSSYLVHGMTRWLSGWKRRGWMRVEGGEVLNRDLWEDLDCLVSSLAPGAVRWVHVKGHAGLPGNERADAIALSFAEGHPGPLYRGPVAGYGHDLSLPDSAVRAESGTGSRADPGRGKGVSRRPPSGRPEPGYPVYLSLVAGKLLRHAAWKDCEALVRGVSGARFKKVRSALEEWETRAGWGV